MKSFFAQLLRQEKLQLLLLFIPFLAALVAMPYATEKVPMQWGFHGQVNWYAPKRWGLFVLPIIMLLSVGVVLVMEYLDESRVRATDGMLTTHGKAVRSIRLYITILLIGVGFLQIAFATGWRPDIAQLLPVGVALLFAFIGNLFGKLKPNRYVGIRVRWTLNSEEVWRRTHRFAGHLWTIGGIALAIVALMSPGRIAFQVTVSWLVVLLFVPLGVAWRVSRTERGANG